MLSTGHSFHVATIYCIIFFYDKAEYSQTMFQNVLWSNKSRIKCFGYNYILKKTTCYPTNSIHSCFSSSWTGDVMINTKLHKLMQPEFCFPSLNFFLKALYLNSVDRLQLSWVKIWRYKDKSLRTPDRPAYIFFFKLLSRR